MGWEVVQRLPARIFHQLWVMSHVVAKVSTQEGRDDLNKERAIRTVIRHEHDPAPAPVIIDTERMTAEQIQELSRAYR